MTAPRPKSHFSFLIFAFLGKLLAYNITELSQTDDDLLADLNIRNTFLHLFFGGPPFFLGPKILGELIFFSLGVLHFLCFRRLESFL